MTAPSTTATGSSAPLLPKAGIYGNDAIEAMYPLTKTLANGEVLDSSKHEYTLFPASLRRHAAGECRCPGGVAMDSGF